MLLAAQSVQSIGDLFLIRIYNREDDDLGGAQRIDDGDSKPKFPKDDDIGLQCDGASIEGMPSHEVLSWARTAARLLQQQWPRQDRDKQLCSEPNLHHMDTNESTDPNLDGSEKDRAHVSLDIDNNDYLRTLIIHHEKSYPRYSLACSYILLKHSALTSTKAFVVGHGRLTECYESAGGNAVAATYILIDPEHRGKGYGRTLLRLLEQEAKSKERLGCQYHFVYLWCKATTAPFYERSGYLPSRNRVSLQRPCLKSLTATSVQSIEDILQRRQRHRSSDQVKTEKENPTLKQNAISTPMMNDKNAVTSTKKKLETVVLLPSSPLSSQSIMDNGEEPISEEDVWLRKRLVDHVESIIIPEEDRRKEIIQYLVESTNAAKIVSNDISSNTIVTEKNDVKYLHRYRWNPHVPWQMQIGPTCGLTAIRMVRDFYMREETQEDPTPVTSSLLADARKLGYTDDGEMFDADNLRDLMKHQLPVVASSTLLPNNKGGGSNRNFSVTMRETSSLNEKEIDSTLQKRGLWIIPYDSNPRTKLPGMFQGKHAHWGVVVGILYSGTDQTPSASATDASTRVPTIAKDISDKTPAFDEKEGSRVYLIVQHSLSSKWAIAPVEDWFESNGQLISVNEDKFELECEQHLNLKSKIIQVVPT